MDTKFCTICQSTRSTEGGERRITRGVPPKKEWVGLTKEERRDIFDSCESEDRGYVAAMVEAKLKEKNNG